MQIDIGPFLVRVRSELVEVDRHLALLYPDFPIADAGWGHFDIALVKGRGVHRVVRPQARMVINGLQPFIPLPARMAGASLEWGINWCIGTQTHHCIPIHAAAVERNSRIMILTAPSGSGKSTLCAAMVYAGWRLFSDEFALLNPATRLFSPSPRPISLKETALDIMKRRHPEVVFGPEAHDVEGTRFAHARPPGDSVKRARETAPAGWIVMPRYVAGSRTIIEPVPRALALMEIADQSFNYNFLGVSGYQALTDVVRGAQCLRLEYSDLDDVLPRLSALMDRPDPSDASD